MRVVALLGSGLLWYGCPGDDTSVDAGGTVDTNGDGGMPVGEQCAEGEFQMTPVAGTPYEVKREVCFHSMGSLGPCPVYNYLVPPSTDFSEFIDIFYGGRSPECEDSMLGEFVTGGDRYLLFGDPTREPPSRPDPSSESVATGNYTVEGGSENGRFEYYWPAR